MSQFHPDIEESKEACALKEAVQHDRPEPTTLPFVSVIIAVWNDPVRLRRCLDALVAQGYPPASFEVIVVDNGSDEEVAPWVEAYPWAIAIRQPIKGIALARNTGLGRAHGEIIAITDSDCVPAPDWLERGVAAVQARPGGSLVAGRIVVFPRDPARPTWAEEFDIKTAFPQASYVKNGHFGATANVFTLRQVFTRVGDFNTNLQAEEDNEWGQRVFAAGFPIVYADDVVVRHPARHSLAALRRKTAFLAGGHLQHNRLSGSNLTVPKALGGYAITLLRTIASTWLKGGSTPIPRRCRISLVACYMTIARGVIMTNLIRSEREGESKGRSSPN